MLCINTTIYKTKSEVFLPTAVQNSLELCSITYIKKVLVLDSEYLHFKPEVDTDQSKRNFLGKTTFIHFHFRESFFFLFFRLSFDSLLTQEANAYNIFRLRAVGSFENMGGPGLRRPLNSNILCISAPALFSILVKRGG